jgi:hypothetical protein
MEFRIFCQENLDRLGQTCAKKFQVGSEFRFHIFQCARGSLRCGIPWLVCDVLRSARKAYIVSSRAWIVSHIPTRSYFVQVSLIMVIATTCRSRYFSLLDACSTCPSFVVFSFASTAVACAEPVSLTWRPTIGSNLILLLRSDQIFDWPSHGRRFHHVSTRM